METLPAVQEQHSVLAMLAGSGPVVQLVLIILILLSIWSWAITIAKFLQFRRARDETREFSSIFWETRNLGRVDDSARRLEASPLTRVFLSGYREFSRTLQESATRAPRDLQVSTIEHALRRAEIEESKRLERGVTFLASVASAAPFIGLFGTVWGIMNAFHGLSTATSTTIQAVAPGISEALVATAVGLAAAIPAAVAFNYLTVGIREFKLAMQSFSAAFVDVARQQLNG